MKKERKNGMAGVFLGFILLGVLIVSGYCDYQTGYQLYQQGDYQGAIQALEADSGGVAGDYLLGLCYMKTQKYEQARKTLQQVIEREPEHGKAWTNLGRVQVRLDRFDEAVRSASRAVRLVGDSGAYNVLGQAFMGKKDYKEADEAFAEAIKKDPQNAWAYNNRAYNLILMSSGAPWETAEEALELLNQALAIDPENPVAQRNREYVQDVLRKNQEL